MMFCESVVSALLRLSNSTQIRTYLSRDSKITGRRIGRASPPAKKKKKEVKKDTDEDDDAEARKFLLIEMLTYLSFFYETFKIYA